MSVLERTAYNPGDRPELFQNPSIFLSSSIPYERDPSKLSPTQVEENKKYVETSKPLCIRAAIVELCRLAFGHDFNLLFGGHPAISPLVLAAARQFVPKSQHRKRVIVFQSLFFEKFIPQETLDLADWKQGQMLWTAAVDDDRDASLRWMREVMVSSPGLKAAVYVGGMEGVIEEAQLFREFNPGLPEFSIGSTGAAAADLLHSGARCYGEKATRKVLQQDLSYPRVIRRIFDDLRAADSLS